MSNIRKSDVKNNVYPKIHTDIHLVPVVSLPDATGFSGSDLETTKASPSGFAQDFLADHSSSPAALAPADQVIGSGSSQAPVGSKSAKA